jgi:hypothetical protein
MKVLFPLSLSLSHSLHSLTIQTKTTEMNLQLSSFGDSVHEIAQKSKLVLSQANQISNGRHKSPHSMGDILEEVPSVWDLAGLFSPSSLPLFTHLLSLSISQIWTVPIFGPVWTTATSSVLVK